MTQATQDEMWEKYGAQQSDMCEIVCEECSSLVCYSYGNIDAVLEEVFILCPDCKETLP